MEQFTNDDNIKPRLKELMKQHRQSESDYRSKQMEKYLKAAEIDVWD